MKIKYILGFLLIFITLTVKSATILDSKTDYTLNINGTIITITAPKVIPPVVIPPVTPSVSTKFMSGFIGHSTELYDLTTFPAHGQDGTGALRIGAGFSHANLDDPLVFPNKPGASHAHAYFGNTSIDAYSNLDNIVNVGNTTSNIGIGNRSAYWVPMIYDSITKAWIKPYDNVVYYKSGFSKEPIANIKPIPKGLKMIVGTANRTTAIQDYIYSWSCEGIGTGGGLTIPDCKQGSLVKLQIKFPQCWDGKNIDSANHKSHMSDYENRQVNGQWGAYCPATHPVLIPAITYNVTWKVDVTDSSNWKLSSDMGNLRGVSAHADYVEGLTEVVRQRMVDNCVKVKDCGGL